MNARKSRRELLRWMALTSTALITACQNIIRPTPAAVQVTEPAPTATHPPEATATPPPTATSTPEPTATLPPTATSTPEPTATSAPTLQQATKTTAEASLPAVYMTTRITSDGLMKMYQALGRKAQGKVAVKISSGEPGGHYYLSPDLIAPLVKEVSGTIVECNTAYGGGRANTEAHRKVMEQHGFTAIAPTDIMDADGTITLPITGGKHLKEDVVGSHFADYDFVVNLAHFKGHQMAGFGGVIKNMSIGIASSVGKSLIHSAGTQTTGISFMTDQDDFTESMAEAAKGVADHLGENILYINVMNNLSIDCDCDGNPSAPTMQDIGILSSLDPVALDQASVDLIYAAPDGKDLIKRMEYKKGVHVLEHGEAIGLGSRKYTLVNRD